MATDMRAALAKLMTATLGDAANWTYAEVRPEGMPTKTRAWAKGTKVKADCGKGVQMLAWWVPGCPDPMGNDFGPYGNSQTIWANAQHLDSPAELEVGDNVTFGPDGDQHAAKVKTAGADPELWSFGHQGAPNTYLLSQDGRPAQFCRQPLPEHVPTADDKLRAKTGWFAWMNWRNGTGDWRHKAPKDKTVRPAVPRVIPLSWWRRRAKFILAAKKGNKATTAP